MTLDHNKLPQIAIAIEPWHTFVQLLLFNYGHIPASFSSFQKKIYKKKIPQDSNSDSQSRK